MSVVGLTFGSAANATRPEGRHRRQRRDERDHARGRVRALVPDEADQQDGAEDQRGAGDPAHACTGGGEERGALLGGERAAGASEHAGDLGGEVPAAGQHLVRLGVGDGAAVAEQEHAGGERRRELGVVGGDDARALAQALGERVAARGVHPARRLVEQQQFGVGVEHELQRRALTLAAGHVARVTLRELGVRHVGTDRLVHQVVAGMLREQRRAAGADAPARRVDEPGDRLQQRRLAGPVAPHQRDRLARVCVEGHALQDRRPFAQLDPHVLDRQRRALRRRRDRRRGGRDGSPVPASRSRATPAARRPPHSCGRARAAPP